MTVVAILKNLHAGLYFLNDSVSIELSVNFWGFLFFSFEKFYFKKETKKYLFI
jgi:hypothetical protein